MDQTRSKESRVTLLFCKGKVRTLVSYFQLNRKTCYYIVTNRLPGDLQEYRTIKRTEQPTNTMICRAVMSIPHDMVLGLTYEGYIILSLVPNMTK